MELTLTLDDPSSRDRLFGAGDVNLKLIRSAFGVRISARDSLIKMSGDAKPVNRAAQILRQLQKWTQQGKVVTEDQVNNAIAVSGLNEMGGAAPSDLIEVFSSSGPIVPKTEGQRAYVRAMMGHDLTFCLGPAGTGKTYLAVAMAASMLKRGELKRIMLVRPAVEAGEKLGYLPGDMQAKVNPYLRPIFDAMHDMMSFEQLKRFMQNDVIEVVPLAFMRGRTLNNAAVILDEAQNTTSSQMLMFLTRLGHDSKMIVTGDDSQVDLEAGRSGLADAVRRLRHVEGIASVYLDEHDIVRHRLVQQIVNAYDTERAARRHAAMGPEEPDSRTLAARLQPEGAHADGPGRDDAQDAPGTPKGSS